jgi:predicted alpha-1,6-mannanase (GH76 family)
LSQRDNRHHKPITLMIRPICDASDLSVPIKFGDKAASLGHVQSLVDGWNIESEKTSESLSANEPLSIAMRQYLKELRSAGARYTFVTLVVLILFTFTPKVQSFTSTNADAIFSAYTTAFYFTNANGGFFRATTDGGKTWFWERAEQLEMLLDVYERTTNTACLSMFTNVFNGFISDHGATWERNEFNDDIMWMVIACARAHQVTGNSVFLAAAKTNFDMCFARAWSTNLGGGLWWKTSNLSKNACVNGPAAIAAYLLYQISGDSNYLSKSKSAYEWEHANLFDPGTGQIWDSKNHHGEVDRKIFTYNLGTFVGAANFLGQTNDAKRAADFTEKILCCDGVMPGYGQVGDGGGFNGICARWMARFMRDRGLQSSYEKWLQANADAAWEMRRAADNLSWSRWAQPTPDGPLHSWACSSSVVMMHVVPPNEVRKSQVGTVRERKRQ